MCEVFQNITTHAFHTVNGNSYTFNSDFRYLAIICRQYLYNIHITRNDVEHIMFVNFKLNYLETQIFVYLL